MEEGKGSKILKKIGYNRTKWNNKTRHHLDIGSASDWSRRVRNLLYPIRSNTQIWAVRRHQYGIFGLVSVKLFQGKPVVASRNFGCFFRVRTLKIVKTT